MIEISVKGRLRAKEFLDLDDVELVPESQFAARQFLDEEKEREHPPYEPVRTAPEYTVEEYIQNGEFNEDLCWDVFGYPKGYLPKWEISAQDMDQWEYWIADGVLEMKNISESGGMQSITISQKVHLKPGKYLLHGETGWVWDDENEDGVCMRVEDRRGVLIAERYWKPGYGRIISDEFTVKAEMDVEVSITVQLPQGANAAIDGIEITESPKKIKWNSAKQVGGVSEKEDTEKIRVTFSAPVFGLEEKHFVVEDAVVTKVSRDGTSAYLLQLEDVAFANEKEIEVRMTAPEYYELDTKKKKVKVYRDMESVSGFWTEGFASGVDWNRENYPDGYMAGWGLPNRINWDVWRYNVTDGIFQVTNISENTERNTFKLHQVVSLPKGTYSIKTNSPWTWDAENTEGIVLQVKEGKKLLVQASGCPGAGVIQSDTFTLEEDTTVDCIIALSVSGGKDAALRYVSLLPTETVSWKSAEQLGGEAENRTTEAVELVFDRDMEELAAEHFQVSGAEVSGLKPLGNGKYRLELSSLAVMDGEQITVSLDAPKGYLVRPISYPVTVYREGESGYSTELVNGDFSVEVDWSNPLYPDGYVEGWELPNPIDWDTWRYYARNGVFGVINQGRDTAEFTIEQEIILPAGEYVLKAESPWAGGDTANSSVKISAEGEAGVLAQAEAQPGTGVFATSIFALKRAAKVTVRVQMKAAPGCEMNIDNIRFARPGAALEDVSWKSALQSGGRDEMAESTGIFLEFSEDIEGLTADQITVTGAAKGKLTAEGNGKYHLEISGLTVKNREEVTVRIKAPEGYQITPDSRQVTVYRKVGQGGGEVEELPKLVNGDFSVEVDWSNPLYPDGYVEGWELPNPIDWDTWNYYARNGVFGVVNRGTKTAEFTIEQEMALPAGEYVLKAESPWAGGDTANSSVKISAEGEAGVLAQAEAQPGTGVFATDTFALERAAKVTVKVQMKAVPGCEMNIDNIRFAKPGAALETISWESALQSGGRDEMAESTGISLEFSEDIEGLTADQITVTGADKGKLTAEGNGKYHLEISGLTVKNGEEVTVRIKAPEGFQITPDSRQVTVYRKVDQGGGEVEEPFEDPIVNGDFSVGVDWDNKGSLEGWVIDPVDWSVWDSYSGSGGEWGNFWVTRTDKDSDAPLSLYQEVELKAGVYTLEANSQGTWDASLTDAVSLSVERDGEVIALKAVQPGYGLFTTDEFTLKEDSLVKVILSFKLPASGQAGIDDVKIAKVDSARMAKAFLRSVLDEEEKEEQEEERREEQKEEKREEQNQERKEEQKEEGKEEQNQEGKEEQKEERKEEQNQEQKEESKEEKEELSEEQENEHLADEIDQPQGEGEHSQKEIQSEEKEAQFEETQSEEKETQSEEIQSEEKETVEVPIKEDASLQDEEIQFSDEGQLPEGEIRQPEKGEELEGSDSADKDNKDNDNDKDKDTYPTTSSVPPAVMPEGQAGGKDQEREGNE